jgi:hypothetical protein
MAEQSDWKRHEGGPNPAPGELVDLVLGFGIAERQPSEKVNWAMRWKWKLSGLRSLSGEG